MPAAGKIRRTAWEGTTCVNVFAQEGAGEEVLSQSFDQAQQAILKGQKEDYHAQDMKTTLVLLHVGEEEIRWGHIGASRLHLRTGTGCLGCWG